MYHPFSRAAVLLLPLITLAPALARAAEFYVSPQAVEGGNGSISQPWTLKNALSHPSSVRPGDTIWLRGGTYNGIFISYLTGTAAAPIVVRQYPGEHARIDGGSTVGMGLRVYGGYTWYWGFEVMFSNPTRYANGTTSTGFPPLVGYSLVEVNAPGTKLINMVIHDGCQGANIWTPSADSEAYGNLIYNVGFDGNDRGHGHGLYVQNQTGPRKLTDNIIFNQYGLGIQAYTSGSYIDNMDFQGNIIFNNGSMSRISGYQWSILLGGGRTAQSPIIKDNYSYYSPNRSGGRNELGYTSNGCTNLIATNNYFAHPNGVALSLTSCPGVISGNTFYGPVQNIGPGTYPNNTFTTARPSGLRVFVRPNRYEQGRAHVAVFNWDRLSSVPVDLSSVLGVGDAYEVRDAQNFFGPAVSAGVYSGQPVYVPMVGLTEVAQPKGSPVVTPIHTDPEFGAFIVVRTASAGAGPVNAPPSVSAGQPQRVTFPGPVTLTGSASDDGRPFNILTSTWSLESGPGTVTFGDANSLSTTAVFGAPGSYVLKLTASDNSLASSSTVAVTVDPAPASGGSSSAAPGGYWTFDAADRSGNRAIDRSGNGTDLTLYGGISPEAGRVGEALVFDGSTGHAVATTDPVSAGRFQLTNDLTLMTWLKTRSRRVEGILSKYDAAGLETGWVLRTTAAGNLNLRVGGNNLVSGSRDAIDSSRSINDGQWHHVAVVVRLGRDVTFYVDGAATATQPWNTKAQASKVALNVGRNPYTPYGANFTGSLDDVRIYGQALAPTDIALAAAGVPPGNAPPPAPDPTPIPTPVNQAPQVSAGSAQTITLPSAANLAGAVSDDGLPSPSALSLTWSVVSGPGSVTFSNSTTASTTATFGTAGSYVLQLTASDGVLAGSATVTITVNPAPSPAPPSGSVPVGHWTMDSADRSSNRMADRSGNGMDLTLYGGVSTDTGRFAEALRFDGSTAFAVANDDPANAGRFQLTGDLTVMTWVKTQSRRVEGLVSKYDAAGMESGWLLRTTAAGNINMRVGGNNLISGSRDVIDSSRAINDGQWHHVAAVIRLGRDVTIYVDGAPGPVQPWSTKAFTSATRLNVGRNPYSGYGLNFTGSLDDIRVYDRALTAAEVAAAAASTSTGGSTTSSSSSSASSPEPAPAPAPVNQRPQVSAGPDQSITLPAAANLNGTASDDGLPSGALAVSWSVLSGPGTVAFAAASSRTTSASFSAAGSYVLRLTASDGQLSASDDVTVNVSAPPPPPPSTPTGAPTNAAAYWTFDSGDLSGGQVADRSGNLLALSLLGGAATTGGKSGQALAFNGTSSEARLGAAALSLLSDMTFTGWVRTSRRDRWEVLFNKLDASPASTAGYLLALNAQGNLSLQLGSANVAAGQARVTTDSARSLNDGLWHHFAIVVRLGQTVTYYVDGAQSSSFPQISLPATTFGPLRFGQSSQGSFPASYSGALDEFRVYNRALTATEVASLAR